jgi:hypothetical protein
MHAHITVHSIVCTYTLQHMIATCAGIAVIDNDLPQHCIMELAGMHCLPLDEYIASYRSVQNLSEHSLTICADSMSITHTIHLCSQLKLTLQRQREASSRRANERAATAAASAAAAASATSSRLKPGATNVSTSSSSSSSSAIPAQLPLNRQRSKTGAVTASTSSGSSASGSATAPNAAAVAAAAAAQELKATNAVLDSQAKGATTQYKVSYVAILLIIPVLCVA